uniref:Putative cytochrome n=1 Tax=Hyalomma excavatum TaxID=257692 RepID=A0A131XD53_9ACAR
MLLSLWIAVLVTLLTTYIWRRRKRFLLFKDLGIPGPQPSFFSGNTAEILEKGSVKAFDEWTTKFGDIVGFYNGGTPVLIVKNTELLRKIQVKDFGNFASRGVVSVASRHHRIARTSLTNAPSERWKEMRSLMTPAFRSSSMKCMLSLVESCVDTFMEVVAAKQTAASVEVRELFQRLSMDIIARSAFGTETGIQRSQGGTAADTLLALIQDRLGEYKNGWLMYFANCFPEFHYLWRFLFSCGKRAVMTPTDYIKNNLASLIEERRANKQVEHEDLLQLMLNAEEEADSLIDVQQLTVAHEEEEVVRESLESIPVIRKRRFMTTTEIQSNAVMFLVAGFETTGTTLSFTSYLLAKYPDIQERTRSEVLSVTKAEGGLTYDSLTKMRYLDQVISEALRYYPVVVGFITRKCEQGYEHQGIKIPSGMSILVPAYQMHHDPKLWSNPEAFVPERFSPENRGKIEPMAYQAYGNGPRNCVAMRFAQLVLKFTLAKLLSTYRLVLDPNKHKGDLKIGSSFTLAYPLDGVWLKLQEVHES